METINVTLAIPEELHRKMKEHDEIRWSTVLKGVLAKKIADLELLNKLNKKSTLTEEDVEELSELIKHNTAKRMGII